MKLNLKKIPGQFVALVLFSMLATMASADDEHDELTYLDEGEIDIAVVFHEDESALEFTIFAEHDEDEHHEEDEGEHHDESEEHHEDEDEHHEEDEEHHHEDEHHEEDEDEHHEEGDDHEHDHGEGIATDDVVILAGEDTLFELPASNDFSFLGEAGEKFYILPQDPTAGPAAPGIATEFEPGVFQNDEVTVSLVAFEGPGELTTYTIDGFGTVDLVFTSGDDLGADDMLIGSPESHRHFAWAFSEPGIYKLSFEASGILASDASTITSEIAVVTFQIGEGISYLREVDNFADGWAVTDGFGSVYTPEFPWMWSTLLGGWLFAEGEGGEAMTLYTNALAQWLYTNHEIAPWYFLYGEDDWIFVVEISETGDSFYWSENTQSWQFLSE